MNTYVISAEDKRQLNAFLKSYRPFLRSEIEQIENLKQKLNEAVIVPQSKLARTVVSMYTTVDILDLDRRESRRYTLSYPQQASVAYNLLSVLSPLGSALLGCVEGNIFECTIPAGTMKFALTEILYQPAWDLRNPHGYNEVMPELRQPIQ